MEGEQVQEVNSGLSRKKNSDRTNWLQERKKREK